MTRSLGSKLSAWPALAVLVMLAGCGGGGSGGGAAHVSPTPSPSATRPSGAVASILCGSRRVAIQADEQTLTVEDAAGDKAAAAALRVKIRDALTAAQALPGCDVSDLAVR